MQKLFFQSHHGGIFSNSNVILSKIIAFFNKYQYLPSKIETQKAFTIYKINDNDDIYKEVFLDDKTEIKYNEEVKFNNEGYENQFSNYKLLNFNTIIPIFNKYFKLNNTILNNVEYLINKYNLNLQDELCGVFYRGNDKVLETQKPTYNEVILKAKELKETNSKIKFVIQTDEKEFLYAFLSVFPDSLYFNEMYVINNKPDSNVVKFLNNKNKKAHVINFVSIIYLFSKLKYLITTSGNCELFIILYRNNAQNLHQYLKKNKYVHGGLNIDYDENNNQVWY
jgi:hypothetical protein